MHTTADIRTEFLTYFRERDHEIVPSSPLVPHQDPTLLFTNAGMVQFKDVFTGLENRSYRRAASAQKCVRAGGKHNDLENVGHTARHHTFFEMLGNFSFGDYFKEQAVSYAWDFLTKEVGLDPNRMVVTVYAEDQETPLLWKKIAGYGDDRIIKISTNDNFWSMGDTGPCGPCSEIFYDHGPHIWGGLPGSAEQDGDRFVEIWNMVFMQYDRQGDGTLNPLPAPSIDTGMGIERLAAVLQGVHNNYDTDILKTLAENAGHLTHTSPVGDALASHRVVADHVRSSAFLIADGVLPSNEGRGYVLRRIMRRAMRHMHLLGTKDPVMWRLVETLVTLMGAAYPELIRAQRLVEETLKQEEVRFRQTLDRGMRLLGDEKVKLGASKVLPGDVAFKLYDTYGFPLDLTQDALKADGIDVDLGGFDTAMARQKQEARAAWSGSGEAKDDRIWLDLHGTVGNTEFVGYQTDQAQALVTALVQQGHRVDSLSMGQEGSVILNQTPFYGESGGQQGDTGVISGDGFTFQVTDTRKLCGGMHVHFGTLTAGVLKTGAAVHATIDSVRRTQLRANHSATHLLHTALRHLLGTHVTQKGSLVAPDKLRFDFSHPTPLTRDQLDCLEREVNDRIRANAPTQTQLMTPEEGVTAGALALFGEKYGDEVRVVSMGDGTQASPYSVELCGGTHVGHLGDIGYFKILSEGSVAAGVRRLEAVTGRAAEDYARTQEDLVFQVAQILKASPAQVAEKVSALMDERKKLTQQVKDLKSAQAAAAPQGEPENIGGMQVLFMTHGDVPGGELRTLVEGAKKSLGSGVVIMASQADGKAALAVGVTADLTDRVNAVELVRLGAESLGGKGGGGRPDLAQAGGPDIAQIHTAFERIRQALSA